MERPDVLLPSESATTTEFLRFGIDDRRAGHIVDRGKGEVAVMTIPLESLSDNQERAVLVKEILKLLNVTPHK